jgi:peptidoglycan/xylan/chitin deacetylase (PgdA/CDA1 family)
MVDVLRSNNRLWNIFTSKEEYTSDILDRYQRYPYYLSTNRNVFKPEVSDFLIKNGLKLDYPNGKKFGVCMTHDIDATHYSKVLIEESLIALKHRRFRESLKLLFSKGNSRSFPFPSFSEIMKLEEKYDAKSSFYFLALDKNNLDYTYKLENLKEDLKTIIDNGWEIGLHGGHEAYNNLSEIRKQKQRLEKAIQKRVIGYRNHFLKFEVPKTWELLKKAGFKYDTTFGYADCVGFRNGTCHPFKPFNLKKNQYIDILEIPITVMASTFHNYMKLNLKNSWKVTKLLIDTVEKYNGVITFLWHNTDMTEEWFKLYKKILDYSYRKKAWITSGEEIWKWWTNNGY